MVHQYSSQENCSAVSADGSEATKTQPVSVRTMLRVKQNWPTTIAEELDRIFEYIKTKTQYAFCIVLVTEIQSLFIFVVLQVLNVACRVQCLLVSMRVDGMVHILVVEWRIQPIFLTIQI